MIQVPLRLIAEMAETDSPAPVIRIVSQHRIMPELVLFIGIPVFLAKFLVDLSILFYVTALFEILIHEHIVSSHKMIPLKNVIDAAVPAQNLTSIAEYFGSI